MPNALKQKLIDQHTSTQEKGTPMSLFNDLSRELLRASSTSLKHFNSSSGVTQEGGDAELFYELAVKSTASQMAYLEHNRVEHMLLKSTIDSFQ